MGLLSSCNHHYWHNDSILDVLIASNLTQNFLQPQNERVIYSLSFVAALWIGAIVFSDSVLFSSGDASLYKSLPLFAKFFIFDMGTEDWTTALFHDDRTQLVDHENAS